MEFPSSRLLAAALLLQRLRSDRARNRAVQAAQQGWRRQAMLKVATWGIVLALAPWGLHFLWLGETTVALVYGIGLLLAGVQALLVRARQTLGATAVLSLTAWLAISLVALWVERPTADLPRSVIFFCVPLYLAQRFLLLHQAAWIRACVQGGTLALFILWTSLPDPLTGPLPLADTPRQIGLISNLLVSALLCLWLLRVESAELQDYKGLALELARSIAAGSAQLQLHLQPQCSAAGEVLGAEALVRWQHPKLGMVWPTRFVPQSEQNGLILPLGEWVMANACRLAKEWQKEPALQGRSLAVNVSVLQLQDEAAFERLLALVAGSDLPAGAIKFELTESVFAAHAGLVRERLQRCRALGIPTALDDFGTGYSSLAYLTDLPFDQLKIDQSFVMGLGQDPRSRHIAEAVIALGQRLGLAVIAEGVETEAQRDLLLALGCHQFQGNWYAKPLPAPEFLAWAVARDRAMA